jgi:hypothetical protein
MKLTKSRSSRRPAGGAAFLRSEAFYPVDSLSKRGVLRPIEAGFPLRGSGLLAVGRLWRRKSHRSMDLC